MSLDFHFTDTPPQDYLNKLHSIDVPKLYDPMLSKNQRGNLVVLIKKRLNEWQKTIQTQITSIAGRFDATEKDKARLLIAPYKTLADLGNALNDAVIELERTMRAGKVVPQGFSFGTHIFGELERGEWHLGEADDARRWDDYVALRRRMEAINAEFKPLLQNVKVSQLRVKEHKEELNNMMAAYKRRKNPLNIILLLVPLLAIVGFTLFAGWSAYRLEDPLVAVMSNQALGAILLVLGTIGAILMVVLVRRRARHIKALKDEIREGRRFHKELQAAFKQARLDFYPTEELLKELRADYKILKATFD